MRSDKSKRKLLSLILFILLASIPVFSSTGRQSVGNRSYMPDQYILSSQKSKVIQLDSNLIPNKHNDRSDKLNTHLYENLASKNSNFEDVAYSNGSIYRAMDVAAKTGDIRLLEELLPQINDLEAPLVPKSSTMMMVAAQYHQTDFIEVLIQNGADINYTTDYGYNALVAAVKAQDIDTISFLLENGAKIQKHDGIGVMSYAIATGNVQVLRLLQLYGGVFSEKSSISPAVMAILQGNDLIFRDIMEADIDLNLQDEYTKRTALLAAVSVNNAEMVKTILDEDVDIYRFDAEGNAALHYVAKQGNTEILQMLMNIGIDVNQINTVTGESALIIAAKNRQCQVIEILMDSGADAFVSDFQGKTASDYLTTGSVCENSL